MTLATELLSADGAPGPRLVLAHGFTQNARCWGPFGQRLAAEREVVAVDAPGHGRSGHDDADLWTAGRLLIEAAGPGVLVGYSMGGRAALHGALADPASVRGLVLIGATAGIDDPAERAERRRADGDLADRLLDGGLEAFLDRWLSLPLFAGLDEAASARAQRLTNRPDGLAASLRHCGTGDQDPLWERLAELTMPVLLIVGDRDHKFSAIAHRMARALTDAGSGVGAEVVSLPGTHAIHLEQPEACAEAILERTAAW